MRVCSASSENAFFSFSAFSLTLSRSAFVAALITDLSGFTISLSSTEISSEKIPQNFDGYEIVQISDLHNVKSSQLTGDLISRIKENSPDIAVITGDTIDSRHTDTEAALDLSLIHISPQTQKNGLP